MYLPALALLAAALLPAPSRAALLLPTHISSGMVIQRGVAFKLWGLDAPGAAVTASFGDAVIRAFANALGPIVKSAFQNARINADSANNLLWLLNNETVQAPVEAEPEPEKTDEASFTEFTLNM